MRNCPVIVFFGFEPRSEGRTFRDGGPYRDGRGGSGMVRAFHPNRKRGAIGNLGSAGCLAFLLLLCGCLDVDDALILHPDGTGMVRLTVTSPLSPRAGDVDDVLRECGGWRAFYPVVSAVHARKFFPSDVFTVSVDERHWTNGSGPLRVIARFTSVNALLASPYGRMHQMVIGTNADAGWTVRTLSGAAVLAGFLRTPVEEADSEVSSADGGEASGVGSKARASDRSMRWRFRITLPRAVNSSVGAGGHRHGRSAEWVFERKAFRHTDAYADRLSSMLEVGCGPVRLRRAIENPTRLGALPFDQMKVDPDERSRPQSYPSPERVGEETRFIARSVALRRWVKFDKEDQEEGRPGFGGCAELHGAFLVSSAWVPLRWGEPHLEQVLDAQGRSLLRKHKSGRMDQSQWNDSNKGGELAEGEKAAAQDLGRLRPQARVMLEFDAPAWDVRRLKLVQASAEFRYLESAEVIRITNAIPAATPRPQGRSVGDASRPLPVSGPIELADERLLKQAVEVRVSSVVVKPLRTLIVLVTRGQAWSRGVLADAQVFDSRGRAWSTMLRDDDPWKAHDLEVRSREILVAGHPEPPFSIALKVGSLGPAIRVPFVLRDLPLDDDSEQSGVRRP